MEKGCVGLPHPQLMHFVLGDGMATRIPNLPLSNHVAGLQTKNTDTCSALITSQKVELEIWRHPHTSSSHFFQIYRHLSMPKPKIVFVISKQLHNSKNLRANLSL